MADDQSTTVDLDYLRTFRNTVDDRLGTATEAVQALETGELSETVPLGGFADAVSASDWHTQAHDLYLLRAKRLVNALEATQAAIDQILDHYTSAEETNTNTMNAVVAEMFDQEDLRMETENQALLADGGTG